MHGTITRAYQPPCHLQKYSTIELGFPQIARLDAAVLSSVEEVRVPTVYVLAPMHLSENIKHISVCTTYQYLSLPKEQ